MAQYYLPADDYGKLNLINNFAAKLRVYAPLLGIDDATLQQVTDDAINFDLGLKSINSFQSFTKTLTTFKNLIREAANDGSVISKAPQEPAMPKFTPSLKGNVFGRLAKLAQAIKAHPNYTLAIGKDLGIVGSDKQSVNLLTAKPVLTYNIKAGRPSIKWKKSGYQGIHIYIDRGDGKGYGAMPFTDTKPDYLDEYQLPAAGQTSIWKYKAIYIKNDIEIGSMSNELSVNVSGMF